MTKKKNIVPFENYELDLPIVKFKIKDKEFLALVDTGCEDSMFDDSLKKYASMLRHSNINLIGFAGEKGVNNAAYFNISFDKCPDEYELFTHVTDMSTISSSISGRLGKDIDVSAFLGASFLNRYNCEVDYQKKVLVLR